MKGWEGSIAGVQNIDLLPNEAKDYIKKIEILINCKIIMISTSPERVDTIYLENPFAFVQKCYRVYINLISLAFNFIAS